MNEEHRRKIIIMRIGVIVVVLIVFGLWLLNLNSSLNSSREKLSGQNNVEWQQMKEELNNALSEVQESLEDMESAKQAAEQVATTSQPSAADNLLEGLIDKTEEIAPSSPDARPAVNCPAWINCMPSSIGEAPNCQIPAGCEGITQIAY
jgi:FtsZ-interacting cell division protein ZipA